jgi:eukaryotic-like serine/threonine-protein kinase
MSFNGPLALWLEKRSGLLSFQEVTIIVQKTSEALQQLHNQQRIHGDINPSTILISIDGGKDEHIDLSSSARSDKNITVNSQLMYTAPEQWNGVAVPATDQYALTVMTYELLTGQPPFQGTPKQVMDLQINVQPAAPSTLNQRVPLAIDGVVLILQL